MPWVPCTRVTTVSSQRSRIGPPTDITGAIGPGLSTVRGNKGSDWLRESLWEHRSQSDFILLWRQKQAGKAAVEGLEIVCDYCAL